MNVKQIIKYIYLVLTGFAFLVAGSTSISIWDLILGLFCMWYIFGIFYLGYVHASSHVGGKQINNEVRKTRIGNLRFIDNHSFVWTCVAIICSLFITKFYTGQTPISLVRNYLSGASVYHQYQQFHALNNIGIFSLKKVPFILMNFMLNFIVVYNWMSIISTVKKIKFGDVIRLAILAVAYLYFGAARGTTFEVFQLGFMLMFVIVSKNSGRRIETKKLVVVGVLVVAAVIAFISITGRRMSIDGRYTVSRELYYERTAVISSLSESIGLIITRLSQYFTFGIFYLSTFIEICLSRIDFLCASMVPFGLPILGVIESPEIVNQVIDQSTNWVPDLVNFYPKLGTLGWSVIVFLMGSCARRNELRRDTISLVILYMIALEMFSLPLGNFIMISSANKLIVLLLVAFRCIEKFNIRIKR